MVLDNNKSQVCGEIFIDVQTFKDVYSFEGLQTTISKLQMHAFLANMLLEHGGLTTQVVF